jgi:DNA gyrase subunit A
VFFSTTGIAYKMKVYRLPLGTPQARGKALVNLLPLKEGETISTLMPLPEDEASWAEMSIMFATDRGTVRRNKLSDFVDVKANGKIAMKLEEGDRLIAVQTCTENDDVLLAAAGGKSIRFPVNDVRVFTGRTSVGVRGIKLEENDHVISMSILRHVDADTGERVAYLRMRRSATGDETPVESDGEEAAEAATISAERYAELEGKEEFILTVTSRGYGKRSSAYEYRIAGRGGQGIANMDITERNGQVVASFPVAERDQIMLVTDGGQLIRCPVNDIRIAGRKTQGVTLFKVEGGERVVSVTRLSDEAEGNGNGDGSGAGNGSANGSANGAGGNGSNGAIGSDSHG